MFLVLCIAAVVLLIWVLLVASAVSALRRKDLPPRKRFLRGVIPVVAGAVMLGIHLRVTVNQFSFNLSLAFLVPVVLGLLAVVAWFRAKQNPGPPAPPVESPQPQMDTDEHG